MIRSFRDKDTEALYKIGVSRRFGSIQKQAARKLKLLQDADSLDDLVSPPGNRLEALQGARAGQHSIRVNDQYRVCFQWLENAAWNVEITDYH